VPDGNYVITVTEGGNIYKTQVVVTK